MPSGPARSRKHEEGDVLGVVIVTEPAACEVEQHRPDVLDQTGHRRAIAIGEANDGVVDGFAANTSMHPVSRSGGPGVGPTTVGRKGPNEPIVCTADLADTPTVQAQVDGYRAAFVHLVETERFAGGFRWVFRKEPGLEALLRELAQNGTSAAVFSCST